MSLLLRGSNVYSLALFFLVTFSTSVDSRPIVILDPAGHAKDSGRLLVEGYERGQTLKFAQALQEALVKKYAVRPVISREPGEEMTHRLQIPSFCNRLCGTTTSSSFFLRLHLYREKSEKPRLFLYHLLFNPLVDLAPREPNPLALVPLYQAHFARVHMTRFFGRKMYEYLNQDKLKKHFDCYPLMGLPLRSLVGITSPAILLEVGICRENKWQSLIGAVVDSLSFLDTL